MANAFTLKIEEGTDVLAKVAEMLEKEKIGEIVFLSAKGYLRDPEVVTHGTNAKVNAEKLRGEYEVSAISGSMLRKSGAIDPQVNVAVTQTGVNTKIGHLVKAKAGRGLELSLRKIDLSKMIM